MMILSEINVFPVKSLQGYSPDSARVEPRGFEHDRRWLLVDEDGKFMTQREFPRMATIAVRIGRDSIDFSAGDSTLSADADPTAETIEVGIWNDRCLATVYGAEVNDWFSKVLDFGCKLVKMPETTRRKVDPDYARHADDHVSFADAFPYLLIGEASLEELNKRLTEHVPMNRFRPNLVVTGSAAFDEDNWAVIRIGDVEFDVVKPCARCVLTTVDQELGVKNGVEPLRTLAGFRTFERDGAKKVLFGQNLLARKLGTLRSGDRVEVLARRS